MYKFLTALLIIAATIWLSGCVTTDESDIPWNTPASWEGSPFIPGLSE